ncbi:MAG: gliding motility-associated C-terminal domain-containing protein [Lewinellaceae bacterium]|nr:gliding motility-associated C-terminal domain-containing protein [Saprospiraceae bacterium]MCB9329622.1 gliding motility-associated C-terminal domain-containing protein [Lewinellaceae bacterium]
MKMRRYVFPVLAIACFLSGDLLAQLDTIHYLPPMHARDEWGPQYLYLSTPEVQAFDVSIRDGSGALLATATISNTQPYRMDLGAAFNTTVLIPYTDLHTPVKNKGLIIDGPKKFYAYFRVHANSGFHAGDLTCKGRAALGKEFRIGHVLQEVESQSRRANFVGVLAISDSTLVILSDCAPGTDLFYGGKHVPLTGPDSVWLQAGESVAFAEYITLNALDQPPNGFMGALLRASKPVAVNCGSWVGAPVVDQANDIGIDQIAPFEQVGKEYILCRGNGSSILEHPVVIAHVNNTAVWLNGNKNPTIVLQAGDYYVVPTSAYSPAGNLYINTSQPVFLYQIIGGASTGGDAMRTAGLMFVPPINCGIPNRVNNIYQPNRIGGMTFDGGLMVVAMRDSSVTVRIDGVPVLIGTPDAVPGNPDFVTYRHLSLFSQDKTPDVISVEAQGAVQVAMYGRNMPASFAAFFSGFSKEVVPEIELTVIGDGVCPDTLIARGRFDGVQWIYEDSVLQYGKDTMLITYAPGRYIATGYLGVCRRNDSAVDTADLNFQSPQFPYSMEEPTCFGLANGEISFGLPYGGIAPYQFSIDNGKTFSSNAFFDGLTAMDYKLVVRDSTGCYNRPYALTMGQPDSFSVEIVPIKLPEPLKPGLPVLLKGVPSVPVVGSSWSPAPLTPCPDCLLYDIKPEENTLVELTVVDAEGCEAMTSMLLLVDPRIYAPNAIAPATFSGNDRFTLFSKDPVMIHNLRIFDRWGNMQFSKSNFWTNDPKEGWDGTSGGKNVLPGVYVFWAEIEMAPGRTEVIKGSVTVVW